MSEENEFPNPSPSLNLELGTDNHSLLDRFFSQFIIQINFGIYYPAMLCDLSTPNTYIRVGLTNALVHDSITV